MPVTKNGQCDASDIRMISTRMRSLCQQIEGIADEMAGRDVVLSIASDSSKNTALERFGRWVAAVEKSWTEWVTKNAKQDGSDSGSDSEG